MQFVVRSRSGEYPVDLDVRYVLLAGYTGRDQEAVRAHVAELAAHGVAAPAAVPAAYPVPATRLVPPGRIMVYGSRTSGEAEFLIVRDGARTLIGVGSDHTDRELEAHSVVKAKQACDKPVTPVLWELDEVRDHWDELRLRGEVRDEKGWAPCQDGTLAGMLTPDRILDFASGSVGPLTDVMVFSGTLPLIGGEFRYGSGFRSTLHDPVLDRTLVCEYAVEELPGIAA